jgi:transcription-repair coupling factor (superfamily II helicase)
MANDANIRKILMVLAAAFPDRKLDQVGIDLYCEMLKDIDTEFLGLAAKEILGSNKFFPAISEIREKVNFLMSKIKSEKSSQEAWEEVQSGIRAYGSYQVPKFYPLTGRTVDAIGGWYHICCECDIEIMRAQFLKMYDNLLKRKQEDARCLPETLKFIENKKSDNIKPIQNLINGFTDGIGNFKKDEAERDKP